MRIAISQPTYLPWIGYFDLIDQVDTFVVLDNVQFEKQSWQQRNRIKTPTGLQWLTVPVDFRNKLDQHIRSVLIREPDFWRRHIRSIELNYRRSPFFDQYYAELKSLYADPSRGPLLIDLNMELIRRLCEKLGVTTPFVFASSLGVSGKRTELLGLICDQLGAREYLSPLGSAGYLLEEMDAMARRSIAVTFQRYQHPEYKQLFPPFVPYSSAIDLLFNEGPAAAEIVRSGRSPAYTPDQVAVLRHSHEVQIND